ncbi:hypothetical protein E2C01_055017 [Portunus trituberculatus]|uniref:Uncharacterized protein n=1 Tax=Portunus trituberculatus TaxID=210409 RepID=A0A5B7GU62_PORTR|nr:hypothetical protein [Portunus trituberculatus]
MKPRVSVSNFPYISIGDGLSECENNNKGNNTQHPLFGIHSNARSRRAQHDMNIAHPSSSRLIFIIRSRLVPMAISGDLQGPAGDNQERETPGILAP